MKRTLSLLALIAALMPLSPLTAEGETRIVTVKGVTIDAENIGNSTGFFDSEKDWDIDYLLCWAAASSNLVAWWQSQNPDYVPENTPDTHADIWDTYRYNFKNKFAKPSGTPLPSTWTWNCFRISTISTAFTRSWTVLPKTPALS